MSDVKELESLLVDDLVQYAYRLLDLYGFPNSDQQARELYVIVNNAIHLIQNKEQECPS